MVNSAAVVPTSTPGGRPWKTLPPDRLPHTRDTRGPLLAGPSGVSMALTYDVRLYSIEVRKDRPKPYRLRWLVGERKHSKSYTLKVQAEGRRSELMSAVRRGDQFDEETGLPVSELRARQGSITWYEHSRAYVARKWALAPAKSRKNYADALATITPALVKTKTGMPDTALMRRALYGW